MPVGHEPVSVSVDGAEQSRRSSRLSAVLHRLADPSLALLTAQLVLASAAMVANVLAARGLAPSGRGEIALLLQLSYLCTAAVLLGSDRSFVLSYHGASPHEAVRGYLHLLWRPALVALCAALVVSAAPLPQSGTWRVSALLVVLFAIVNAFVWAMRQTSIAARLQREFLTTTVVTQVLLVGLLLGLLLAEVRSPRVWMLAYVVSATVPTSVYFARRLVGRRHGAGRTPTDGVPDARSRAVRREGLALLPAALANMATLRVDRLMLAALASITALGLYATVSTLTEMLAWPLVAYADSRVGAWRAAHSRGDFRPGRFLALAGVYAVVVGAVLGVISYVCIVPLFGPRFEPAKEYVLPLVLAAAVYAVARISIAILVARRRTAWVSVVETVGFVVSMVAYVLLIPPFGAYGAAYGSLIGYGSCLVATLMVLARRRAEDRGNDR